MPCNSEYLNATGKEAALSQVACLLDELDGKPINSSHWSGYHPAVYSQNVGDALADKMVAELCQHLQSEDVTKRSLEMQIWWRDHQAADKARVEHEVARAKTEAERQAVLAKLTEHERNLLGL